MTATSIPASLKKLSLAASAVGTQLLLGIGAKAAPPQPELDYADAYGDSSDINFYVQWEAGIYSDPDSVDMTFYWGDNSTTLGEGAYHYGADCTASQTSQSFQVSYTYNSSEPYEVGVQAYDDSGYSNISWIGTTNE